MSKRTVSAPHCLPRIISVLSTSSPTVQQSPKQAAFSIYCSNSISEELFERSSMELCISSTTPHRVSFSSLARCPISLPSCSSVRVKGTVLNFSHKLSFLSGKSCPLEPLVSSSSTRRFTASVAVGAESDRLPADIQVTEAEEPNSRVSFLVRLYTLLNCRSLVELWCIIHRSKSFVCVVSYVSLCIRQIRLSVEVPPAVCEDCYRRVIKEFMKQAKVIFH